VSSRSRSILLLLAPLSLLLATPAPAADTPVAVGNLIDLQGIRALGVSAATATVIGTEGIFSNPGAIGVRQQFSAETMVLVDRRGSDNVGEWLVGSAVDGMTSAPVAASFGFVLQRQQPQNGNSFYFGMATPMADKLNVGVQVKYLNWYGAERVQVATLDAGFHWEFGDLVTLAGAGFNLLPTGHPTVLPRGMAGGLSIGSDTGFRVSGDWRGTFDAQGKILNRYAVGAEALFANMFSLRAGWMLDGLLDTSWGSVGLGIATPDGLALLVSGRQSLADKNAREFGVSLKIFKSEN
jgi:hypothetical protein